MPAALPTLDEIEALMRRVVREEMGAKAAPDVLSTEAAAEYVARVRGHPVTAKTVRAWISEGLPAGKRGRLRTILRADLERWLAGERPPADKGDAILRSVG